MLTMIILTLSEDRMEIKKKSLLTSILVCEMLVMPPKHTHPKEKKEKRKT